MKVQIFDPKIYILDRMGNALHVFDENGKFLRSLQKIGQGPGEYRTLWDFAVTGKGLYLSVIRNRISSARWCDYLQGGRSVFRKVEFVIDYDSNIRTLDLAQISLSH
jgi:hypothetical protein